MKPEEERKSRILSVCLWDELGVYGILIYWRDFICQVWINGSRDAKHSSSSPGQTVILGSQGWTIISKNIHFKRNINHLFFSELWWMLDLIFFFFANVASVKKSLLIRQVSISWIQIGRPSAAHISSKSEINLMFPDKTWEYLIHKKED